MGLPFTRTTDRNPARQSQLCRVARFDLVKPVRVLASETNAISEEKLVKSKTMFCLSPLMCVTPAACARVTLPETSSLDIYASEASSRGSP